MSCETNSLRYFLILPDLDEGQRKEVGIFEGYCPSTYIMGINFSHKTSTLQAFMAYK